MTHNFLTVHSLTAIPRHNLNADENGLPKQIRQGGVARGVMSAQSLKHAARTRFETECSDTSIRSSALAAEAVRRAERMGVARKTKFDSEVASKTARAVIQKFGHGTKSSDSEDERKDLMLWLSDDEIDALATHLLDEQAVAPADFIDPERTTSLAIAAFGRMFAAEPGLQTHSAVAVGPAVTTHGIVIESDSFATVDDLSTGKGAGHLGQRFFTSGVYYRSFTIDRRQLTYNWTGWGTTDETARLSSLLRSLVLTLPQGQRNSSAADTRPAVIVAEQQRYRSAYAFDSPVMADQDGGHLKVSARELATQTARAHAFDPDQFDETIVSGEQPNLYESGAGVPLPDLITGVIDWLRP